MVKSVLHICYSGFGGQPNAAMNLALQFNKVNGNKQHQIIFCGIEPLHEKNKKFCEQNDIPYYSLLKKKGADVLFFRKLYKKIIALSPNVVISHTNSYHFILKMYKLKVGCKIITVEHHSIALKSKKSMLDSRISGIVSNKVVAITEEAKEYFIRKNIIKPSKIFYIPNGVANPGGIVERKIEKDILRLGIATRMDPGKDIATVLKAMRALSQNGNVHIQLFLTGKGVQYDQHMALAKEVGVSQCVTFLGFVTDEQLVDFFEQTDILIQSTEGEGLCTTILEAFSYGIPVIGTNVIGVNNLIEDGKTGLLFELGNEVDLSDKIMTLVNNKVLYQNVSKASRGEFLAKYDIAATQKMYEQLINNL